MLKQQPATIAEVDRRRGRAAQDLRVAERKLLAYIKKATVYQEEAPALQDLLWPDGRPVEVEEVSGGLYSRGECMMPRNKQGIQATIESLVDFA